MRRWRPLGWIINNLTNRNSGPWGLEQKCSGLSIILEKIMHFTHGPQLPFFPFSEKVSCTEGVGSMKTTLGAHSFIFSFPFFIKTKRSHEKTPLVQQASQGLSFSLFYFYYPPWALFIMREESSCHYFKVPILMSLISICAVFCEFGLLHKVFVCLPPHLDHLRSMSSRRKK